MIFNFIHLLIGQETDLNGIVDSSYMKQQVRLLKLIKVVYTTVLVEDAIN